MVDQNKIVTNEEIYREFLTELTKAQKWQNGFKCNYKYNWTKKFTFPHV